MLPLCYSRHFVHAHSILNAHAFRSGRTASIHSASSRLLPVYELCVGVRGVEAWRCESSEPQRGRKGGQYTLHDALPAQSHHSQEIEIWVQCPGSGPMKKLKPLSRLSVWHRAFLMFWVIAEKEYTHLNPRIQTDMFLQLQPYDTRPGNWLCCPGQKRNRRERSADMVSSDREYSARDVQRLADAFMYATRK